MKHSEFIQEVRPDLTAARRKEYSHIPSRLLNKSVHDKKVGFWAELLTQYSWARRSLSLSEQEISSCFHLSYKDVQKIVAHMRTLQLVKLLDGRYVFTMNVKKLNELTRKQLQGFTFLTLNELQAMTIYEFVSGKKHNQQIIEDARDFCIELKYKDKQLHGAKIADF